MSKVRVGRRYPRRIRRSGDANTCSGKVASETFNAAVCSCEDTNVQGYLRTRRYEPGWSRRRQ